MVLQKVLLKIICEIARSLLIYNSSIKLNLILVGDTAKEVNSLFVIRRHCTKLVYQITRS